MAPQITIAHWAMLIVAMTLPLHPRAACHAFSLISSAPTPASQSLNASPHLQIFYDSSNYMHRNIEFHPECPDRVDHCLDAIRRHFSSENIENLGASVACMIDVAVATDPLSPPIASSECTLDALPGHLQQKNRRSTEFRYEYSSPLSKQELKHATNILSKIHDFSHVVSMKNKCDASRQRRLAEGKDPLGWIGYIDGSDTYITTETHYVGVRATAAWIRAVDAALGSHDAEKYTETIGMALTRPPGHHATHSMSNGFCIYNFAMAATKHALSINPTMKISILDWDVHFGQGLMDILDKCSNDEGDEYDWTSNVRYASLHQVPCFPHEGQTRKIQGKYENVMTIPIQPESTWCCGYKDLFTTYALPFICTKDVWEPDLVIVCAGYDALDGDELASVNLVAKDYGEMTRLLHKQIEFTSKQPAVVFGLEGGYQLREVPGGNLSDGLIETIKAMGASRANLRQ